MRRFFYCLLLFLSGGLIYTFIEIAFRGHTHITMFFAGGLCLFLISGVDRLGIKLWKKLVAGGLVITAVELVFGVVFNLIFHMGVWDYSAYPWNVAGQICPIYTLAWTALTLPAIWISRIFGAIILQDDELKEEAVL